MIRLFWLLVILSFFFAPSYASSIDNTNASLINWNQGASAESERRSMTRIDRKLLPASDNKQPNTKLTWNNIRLNQVGFVQDDGARSGEQSLSTAMSFVVRVLNEQPEISRTETRYDSSNDSLGVRFESQKYSNVKLEPGDPCTISDHFREIQNGNVIQDVDERISFRNIKQVKVESGEKLDADIDGRPGMKFVIIPHVTYVVATHTIGEPDDFGFSDDMLAEQFAKAAWLAAQLCWGGA